MAQEEMKWGIYINFGNQSEYDLLKTLKFPTRKKALYWVQNYKNPYSYPQKCIMRISEILERNPHYYD